MDYESLYKLYYKNPTHYESIYTERFYSPFTKHLPISIKPFNHTSEYECFYCYTEEMATLQDKIMSTFFSFYQLIELLPQAGILQFLYTSLIEEIQSSNDIEGVHSTRKEIQAALESKETMRLSGIVRKYEKIIFHEDIPLKTCQDIRTLYDDFLSDEIKNHDPENLPDGQLFRKHSVDIVSGTQKVLHRGLYPEQKIIDTMNKALAILRAPQIPTFIRIAIFHYLFGYIHPFYDGNGRMSRFITSYLLSKQLHPTIGLQVSILIKQNRKTYYKLFEEADSEQNKGDLTPFIIGTLEFIYTAITHTTEILQQKLDQYTKYRSKLYTLNITDKTTFRVYDILLQATVFSNIGATINEIAQTLEKTESTIYSRLKKIPEEQKIVLKDTRPYHYKLNVDWLQFL